MPNLEEVDFSGEENPPTVSPELMKDSCPWKKKLMKSRNQFIKEQASKPNVGRGEDTKGQETKCKKAKTKTFNGKERSGSTESATALHAKVDLPVMRVWDHDKWDSEFLASDYNYKRGVVYVRREPRQHVKI